MVGVITMKINFPVDYVLRCKDSAEYDSFFILVKRGRKTCFQLRGTKVGSGKILQHNAPVSAFLSTIQCRLGLTSPYSWDIVYDDKHRVDAFTMKRGFGWALSLTIHVQSIEHPVVIVDFNHNKHQPLQLFGFIP